MQGAATIGVRSPQRAAFLHFGFELFNFYLRQKRTCACNQHTMKHECKQQASMCRNFCFSADMKGWMVHSMNFIQWNLSLLLLFRVYDPAYEKKLSTTKTKRNETKKMRINFKINKYKGNNRNQSKKMPLRTIWEWVSTYWNAASPQLKCAEKFETIPPKLLYCFDDFPRIKWYFRISVRQLLLLSLPLSVKSCLLFAVIWLFCVFLLFEWNLISKVKQSSWQAKLSKWANSLAKSKWREK